MYSENALVTILMCSHIDAKQGGYRPYTALEWSNLVIKIIGKDLKEPSARITSYNVCYTKLLRSVEVTNKGNHEGSEIVQLYVNDIVSTVVTPIKELKGFKRVLLNPNETKCVEIDLKVSDLTIVIV